MPPTRGAVKELSRHVVFYNVVLCAFPRWPVDFVARAKPTSILLAPAAIFATYITPCPGAVMVIELIISLDLRDCFNSLFHCFSYSFSLFYVSFMFLRKGFEKWVYTFLPIKCNP